MVFGIGTALPVIIFAVGIALGATWISHWFGRISKAEKYLRKITGGVFILVGAYYVLRHMVHLF